jgi:hypothetical protein
MAYGQVSQFTGSLPDRRKKVCRDLDIEKEPLKVKHSLEFLPMGVRHRPHPVMEFLDSVTWPKDEHGDAHAWIFLI